MPLVEPKYKYDQYILKLYGYGNNKKLKLTRMNVLRTSGLCIDDEEYVAKCSVNSEKLDNNIRRAKQKIFELAFCNSWELFFTGTLDATKYDRSDLNRFHSDLTRFIRNYNSRYNFNIKFLFIPELHNDGKSWHIHGFFKGLPVSHLSQFKIGDIMGKSISKKVKNGDIVYNWLSYSKKFGFCDLEPIRNAEAISKYITKYINKNLSNSVTELNAHLYYHSRGLKTAETIKKGSMITPINIEPDYSNEYCSVYWLPYNDELLDSLKDSLS